MSPLRQHHALRDRRLRFQALEPRHLLAGIAVTNALDVVNGTTSSIAELLADDGGDGISLREAILAANASVEADTITFDPVVFADETEILLSGGELVITDTLTIDGSGTNSGVVIDAQHQSRIFAWGTHLDGDLHLVGLDLRNGEADVGGAIRFTAAGRLTITDSEITGSRAVGEYARGGAIYVISGHVEMDRSVIIGNRALGERAAGGAISTSGPLTIRSSLISDNGTEGLSGWGGALLGSYGEIVIMDSTVTGNFTLGDHAAGGAVYSRHQVRITDSVVQDNHTVGVRAHGGAIAAASVQLTRALVAHNYTRGPDAHGGAVSADIARVFDSELSGNYASGWYSDGGAINAIAVHLHNSLLHANSTTGQDGSGGGLSLHGGKITGSTISGNLTDTHGGGIAWLHSYPLEILDSTIVNNRAQGATSEGGGLWNAAGSLVIRNSIIADNFNTDGTSPDVRRSSNVLDCQYSIIGNTQGSQITPQWGTNNLLDVDPLIAPLAHNGGVTKTHALLPGSPAINAGDPNRSFVTDEYDQRGVPYVRVAEGRLDIGAYEAQGVVTAAPGDFNRDGVVDMGDYPLWRNSLGALVAPLTFADGDGDGTITVTDYLVWKSHFGYEFSPPEVQVAASLVPRSGVLPYSAHSPQRAVSYRPEFMPVEWSAGGQKPASPPPNGHHLHILHQPPRSDVLPSPIRSLGLRNPLEGLAPEVIDAALADIADDTIVAQL